MNYIAAGNIIVDKIIYSDGTLSEPQVGGPVCFGLTGMRLFTKDCEMLANAGADFDDLFGEWMRKNNFNTDGVYIKSDFSTVHILEYLEDGNYREYNWDREIEMKINFGFLHTTPEMIEKHAMGAKGVYLAHAPDVTFWKQVVEVRSKCGFKIMWEIEPMYAKSENIDNIRAIAKEVDAFSLNMKEAKRIFDTSSDDVAIKGVQSLGSPYTILRAGDKGAYAIYADTVKLVPAALSSNAVDPTGCGNSSTAAALYALCEGYSPVLATVYANVAAHFNVQYKGLIDNFTDDMTDKANKMVQDIYSSL